MHVHAFSPLEVTQGAATSVSLAGVSEAPEGRRPGHAAGHGGRDPRRRGARDYLPDKIDHATVARRHRAPRTVGLRTTSTIMYGHVEAPLHWARHLLRVARPAGETGGFTEFVPLPFVHMEAPMYLQGLARRGPTFREAVLMHAVARLVLTR
jgi:FO synthase